ncbi:MAG: T9SS type A sorting domain-containing protein [candidate division WOR-3 bacterium]|nr:T9SS type A sorting domain-containing protein [candidate division WOR-3 bacterium]
MAVTEAGNPILVFDNINGSDNHYPFEGKIFVSIASGQPCIEVGITTTGAENFYPTIATGGNYVVVLFGEPRYGTGENTFWDIYYNYSTDNGITWHTPRSLTSNITDHNNCLWQIAKRLDPSGYGQFFFAFGCGLANPLSDLYYLAGSNISAPSRWYVGRNPVFGIAENKNVNSRDYLFKIMPNPAVDGLKVKFALARYGHVRIDIYDATGLLIRNLVNSNFDKGNHTLEIDLNDDHAFSNGVYFVKMHTSNYEKLEKLVIVR